MIAAWRARRQTALGIAVASVACFLALAVLYGFDPADHSFYPRCQFKAQTGWDCPGCGLLRATHQLLHGHVRQAAALNPLILVIIPVSAGVGVTRLVKHRTGRDWLKPVERPLVPWLLGAALLIFGIARNLH